MPELCLKKLHLETDKEQFGKKVINTPLYRRYCDDLTNKTIALICHSSNIEAAKEFVQQFKNLEIKTLYLTGDVTNSPQKIEVNFPDKKSNITVKSLDYIDIFEDNIFFVFYDTELADIYSMTYSLGKVGLSSYTYYCPVKKGCFSHNGDNNYLKINTENLYRAYNLLEDEESKEVFISRVKAITAGDAGYLKASSDDVYYSKNVKPELGDVIIDAGVSNYIVVTKKLARTVGKQGKVYSFEPEPHCFKEAVDKIASSSECGNVEIFEYGLWDKKAQLKITENGSASRVCEQDDSANSCELITLDEFVKEKDIKKIDFIKMDIEGAELKALYGSVNTLTNFKPKLAICAYHCPSHLFELILFINSLDLGYKFFLQHHGTIFFDTVLYAAAREIVL